MPGFFVLFALFQFLLTAEGEGKEAGTGKYISGKASGCCEHCLPAALPLSHFFPAEFPSAELGILRLGLFSTSDPYALG